MKRADVERLRALAAQAAGLVLPLTYEPGVPDWVRARAQKMNAAIVGVERDCEEMIELSAELAGEPRA
jgi:hypothetical protein